MVTSNDKNNSQDSAESAMHKLLNRTSQKWDLEDPNKRDSWMLRTLQKLEKAGDDVLRAAREGPPTPEWVMDKNCTLTPRQAEKLSTELMDDFRVANATAYDVLLERIDLEKRASLASRIARHAESQDGHAVWQIIMEACEGHVGEMKTKAETGSDQDLESIEDEDAEFYDDGEIAYSQGYDWIQGSVMYEGDDGDYIDGYDVEDGDSFDDNYDDDYDDEYDDFDDGYDSDAPPPILQNESLKSLKQRAREMERRGEFGEF